MTGTGFWEATTSALLTCLVPQHHTGSEGLLDSCTFKLWWFAVTPVGQLGLRLTIGDAVSWSSYGLGKPLPWCSWGRGNFLGRHRSNKPFGPTGTLRSCLLLLREARWI